MKQNISRRQSFLFIVATFSQFLIIIVTASLLAIIFHHTFIFALKSALAAVVIFFVIYIFLFSVYYVILSRKRSKETFTPTITPTKIIKARIAVRVCLPAFITLFFLSIITMYFLNKENITYIIIFGFFCLVMLYSILGFFITIITILLLRHEKN